MTNNLAVVKLWASRSDIGMVSLQPDDLTMHLEIAEGLDGGMTRRGEDDFVPFRTGRRRVRQWGDARPIVLNGWVMDTAASPLVAYRTAMDRLLRIFRESDEALFIVAQLEDGSLRWNETWHPNVLAPTSEDTPPGIKRVSVEVSGDPYWYGTLGMLAWDGSWTLAGWYTLPSSALVTVRPDTDPYDVTIEPLCTAPVERIQVVFRGISAGPVGCSVVETGVGFTFGSAVPLSTSRWVVDNAARTVLDESNTNLRTDLTLNAANSHGEYISLPRRTASTLRITGGPTRVDFLITPTFE